MRPASYLQCQLTNQLNEYVYANVRLHTIYFTAIVQNIGKQSNALS